MKIAVLHNFLDNIGGAEMVTLTLARKFNADVYTTNIDQEKIIKMGFGDVVPRLNSVGKVPLNAPFKQQFSLWKFRKLDLKNKYDFFIICGDWAVSAAINNKPNLWYVHSPIREIWDLYEYTRQNIVPWFLRWFFDIWVRLNRFLNKKYVKEVGRAVCNSKNTQERLKNFLDKDAVVIYPPIETSKFFCEKNGKYWLSVNRLITHKRVDLQLKAFAKMPEEKLVIVGSYENSRHFLRYAEYCKNIKSKNVEIKSWVSEKELINLYANCKGFITTSHDEDFGMNVVEAMASGKPVIAPNEGGYKETILNGTTGILINNINEDKIVEAVKKISPDSAKFKEACKNRARLFDTEIFIKKIKEQIEKETEEAQIQPTEKIEKPGVPFFKNTLWNVYVFFACTFSKLFLDPLWHFKKLQKRRIRPAILTCDRNLETTKKFIESYEKYNTNLEKPIILVDTTGQYIEKDYLKMLEGLKPEKIIIIEKNESDRIKNIFKFRTRDMFKLLYPYVEDAALFLEDDVIFSSKFSFVLSRLEITDDTGFITLYSPFQGHTAEHKGFLLDTIEAKNFYGAQAVLFPKKSMELLKDNAQSLHSFGENFDHILANFLSAQGCKIKATNNSYVQHLGYTKSRLNKGTRHFSRKFIP